MKIDFSKFKAIIPVLIVVILSYQTALVIQEPLLDQSSSILSVVETELSNSQNSYDSKVSNTKQGFIPHDPIVIQSNEDLELIASSGAGTFYDPFIIENLSIISSAFGIMIIDTSSNFIIRNCMIESSAGCIYITNCVVETVIIDDNELMSNTGSGIDIDNNPEIIIKNNNIEVLSESYNAIILNNCPGSLIFNNYCCGGIIVRSSFWTNITNNSCNNGRHGIEITNSASSIIEQNNCTDNRIDGVYSNSCYEIKITNNLCLENARSGISVIGEVMNDLAVISKNTCESNSWDGIAINKLHISNITNNLCKSNVKNGISIEYSYYSAILENTILNNSANGILFESEGFLCDIKSNFIAFNELFVVNLLIPNCKENKILFNSFYGKNQISDESLAQDCGNNNTWFGNYWENYNGEYQYLISGSAYSFDPMPLKSEEDTSKIDLYDIYGVIVSDYYPNNIDPLWSQIFDPVSIMFLAIISIEIIALILLHNYFKIKKVKIDKTKKIKVKERLLADRDLGIELLNNLNDAEK